MVMACVRSGQPLPPHRLLVTWSGDARWGASGSCSRGLAIMRGNPRAALRCTAYNFNAAMPEPHLQHPLLLWRPGIKCIHKLARAVGEALLCFMQLEEGIAGLIQGECLILCHNCHDGQKLAGPAISLSCSVTNCQRSVHFKRLHHRVARRVERKQSVCLGWRPATMLMLS